MLKSPALVARWWLELHWKVSEFNIRWPGIRRKGLDKFLRNWSRLVTSHNICWSHLFYSTTETQNLSKINVCGVVGIDLHTNYIEKWELFGVETNLYVLLARQWEWVGKLISTAAWTEHATLVSCSKHWPGSSDSLVCCIFKTVMICVDGLYDGYNMFTSSLKCLFHQRTEEMQI